MIAAASETIRSSMFITSAVSAEQRHVFQVHKYFNVVLLKAAVAGCGTNTQIVDCIYLYFDAK